MTIQSKKPILIAGISLSFLLWFGEIISSSLANFSESGFWILICVGLTFWLIPSKKNNSPSTTTSYKYITKSQLDKVFTEIDKLGKKLEQESSEINNLSEQVTQLKDLLSRQSLQGAIIGENKVNRSSLKNILDSKDIATKINFIQINTSLNREVSQGIREENQDKLSLESFDLLLFLINGDLTDFEWQFIKELNSYYHRIVLLINEQDLWNEEDKTIILKHVKERVESIISSNDVIAVTTNPSKIKVKKYQENGLFQEWWEKPKPELSLLINRLQDITINHNQQLILATTYRQAIALRDNLKQQLNEQRKKQALPLIEQYQWIAGSTAFANPVSSLDLLATAAINTQMLLDLGSIYERKLSLDQAKIASVSIAKLMVKLGLVEISTQTIASILKSNFMTYVAGGVVQGISAAYLTRIVGLSLIEYFPDQEINNNQSFNLEQLKQKIQTIFQENQKMAFLHSFVKKAVVKTVNN
jgi:uncharacterized protein (DUF697 family)